MSDEDETTESGAGAEEARDPQAGERLRDARRALKIPIVEIAKELHLDEYKVRAIEENDFEVIGAPVFAKGHLRKYAQLVKVSEADVMADYYQLNRTAGAAPVVSIRPRPYKGVVPGPWITSIVVICVVASAYWWFAVREIEAQVPTLNAEALPQQGLEIEAGAARAIDTGVVDGNTTNEGPIESEQPQVDMAAIDASGDDDTGLILSYSGDCWTEITDANGRRLFFGLGQAGRKVELAGQAPFNVLFGDAANVDIEVDGRAFDIPATNLRGRTASLTISSQ